MLNMRPNSDSIPGVEGNSFQSLTFDIWMETETAVHTLHAKGLSSREMEVLIWVARGKINSEIGMILHISPRTVSKHLEHIYAKLGVECRTAAVVRLLEIMQESQQKQEISDEHWRTNILRNRVLLVDDDIQNRLMLRSILEGQRYSCGEVNNGAAALEFLKEDTVDLVITDNRMPVLGGLQFLQQLSSNQQKDFPPVIMYTGNLTSDLMEQAYKAGVYALVEKPCDTKELLAIVAEAIQQTYPNSTMQNVI